MSDAVHTILGVRVHDVSPMELRERLRGWLLGAGLHIVVTPNPEFILVACKNPGFRDLLNRADMAVADGVGLAYAVAALSDGRLEHRQTGVDLVEELAALCAKEGKSLLLFGGREESAHASARALRKRYPKLHVYAHEPGRIVVDATHGIQVPRSDMDVLRLHPSDAIAVGLGQEKQERFMADIVPLFPATRVAIGIGGAFEMISGRLPRAPRLMRRVGLEWLWRLSLEPRRFPRIFRAAVVFPFVVILATLKQRRFWKACLSVLKAKS